MAEYVVGLTDDEWSLVICGLRDCADRCKARATGIRSRFRHEEDNKMDLELVVQNNLLADSIERQVFRVHMEEEGA